MPFITVFSAPKPFSDTHIATIQRNAVRSWLNLAPADEVKVVLVGSEDGLAENARFLGVEHFPQVACNASGTPLVNSIFAAARQAAESDVLLYINADVMLVPAVLDQIRRTMQRFPRFLMVGQRWDFGLESEWDFNPGWDSRLEQVVRQEGRLHPPAGSDYFIFPPACFTDIPPFAIGRAGWDNWMIYEGRRRGWPVIDASQAVFVVHQDHDYAHLPGGQTHHHLPETYENVRLAGGKRAIFHLEDANWRLTPAGEAVRIPLTWRRFLREAEIFPLVSLHSTTLGNLAFALHHPVKAWGELRAWLGPRVKKLLGMPLQDGTR